MIEAAKAARAEAAAKAAVEQAKSELARIETHRQQAVSDLRDYRGYAKEKELRLAKQIDAENAYNKTGDFETYRKATRDLGFY